ncbi:MAG TPA: flagellar modification protein B [Synechococcales bacterium UBA10510]|jgi:CMP-N-acetylneuraminic acid synthetase|nr:flagellar modification protein B [Synechococcales bacterium UBA10510]
MPKPLTIATICARGGSRGLPGKNIRPLLGKPLITYSIEQALAQPQIDRVFVSTDAPDIAAVATAAGAEVPFLRPAHLATHDAAKVPVIEHLVTWVSAHIGAVDRIVDLDPTSPLREGNDIKACLALLDDQTDTVITAYAADKNPYFNMVEIQSNGCVALVKTLPGGVTSRQAAPRVYSMNASIYCWHHHTLSKGLWQGRTRLHVMPRERSIDIDDPIDFELVELLMRKKLAAG